MNVSHPVRHALIATVVSIAFALSTATVGANPLGDDTQPFALYVSTNQGQAYQSIDLMTLTDLDSASALMFDHDWPELAVSADGSTFVIIEPSRAGLDQWIAVRDGIGGTVRQTITPTETVYGPRLNADGSRVVVRAPHADPCGPGRCPAQTWHTYDTSTGDLMATIRANDGDPLWPDLIDPAGERLYYPFYDRQASSSATANDSSGPWPLQIAAFDLDTGQEAATMTVPGVSAGSWQAESIDQMYVGEMELPAVTLSPDGSRLAVIDAALETLTLLDAGTLAVQETHAIHRSESLTDRLLGWLGLVPQSAQAKVSEGRSLRAAWSADGQSLYLTGHEIEVGETMDDITGPGLGISKIDVGTGDVTAVAREGRDADFMVPAPDRRSLYVLMPETPWWDNGGGSAYVLRRLDADSLETMAGRRFDAWPQIMLVPRGDAQANH